MNARRAVTAANLLLILGGLAWGVYLLSMARSKADYVVDRVGTSPLPCAWSPLGNPEIATLGLSHEPHHSWIDRRVAYVSFRAPPLPRGGSAEFEVIALVGKRINVSVRDESGKVRVDDGGIYRVTLAPSDVATVRTIELRMHRMLPPDAGGDSRWLGAAISRFRACPVGEEGAAAG